MKVYDATNQILGRMSTRIAKELLMGETVHLINCEKACISGDPEVTKKHYLERRQRGDPHHGPFYPRPYFFSNTNPGDCNLKAA